MGNSNTRSMDEGGERMNESARPIPAQPINDKEAIKLLEESNKGYREILLARDGEIRSLRWQLKEAQTLTQEYRDILKLLKDIRHDSLHHDC